EQVVAPLDGRPQGLLARGAVSGPTGKDREPLIQALRQLPWRQKLDPSSRQLERQRQTVDTSTDVANRLVVVGCEFEIGPDGTYALSEEGERIFVTERGNGVLLLRCKVKRFTARGQRVEPFAAAKKRRELLGRLEDMLEVVEDQKHGLLGEPLGKRIGERLAGFLPNADRGGDGREDERRVGDRLEGNEVGAALELSGGVRRRLHGETRLADAARARQRHEAVLVHDGAQLSQLPFPPDERRRLHGEVRRAAVERVRRGERRIETVRDHLEQTLRSQQILEAMLAEISERDVGRIRDEPMS